MDLGNSPLGMATGRRSSNLAILLALLFCTGADFGSPLIIPRYGFRDAHYIGLPHPVNYIWLGQTILNPWKSASRTLPRRVILGNGLPFPLRVEGEVKFLTKESGSFVPMVLQVKTGTLLESGTLSSDQGSLVINETILHLDKHVDESFDILGRYRFKDQADLSEIKKVHVGLQFYVPDELATLIKPAREPAMRELPFETMVGEVEGYELLMGLTPGDADGWKAWRRFLSSRLNIERFLRQPGWSHYHAHTIVKVGRTRGGNPDHSRRHRSRH